MVVATKVFLKSLGVGWNDHINLEFIETKGFITPFKYINIFDFVFVFGYYRFFGFDISIFDVSFDWNMTFNMALIRMWYSKWYFQNRI